MGTEIRCEESSSDDESSSSSSVGIKAPRPARPGPPGLKLNLGSATKLPSLGQPRTPSNVPALPLSAKILSPHKSDNDESPSSVGH